MATIAGIATGDARFTVLVNALQFVDTQLPGSNLVAALSAANADLTVFAPTDAAFGQLAKDLGFTGSVTDEAAVTSFLTESLPATVIRDVLLYHVSEGAKTFAQIRSADAVPTLLDGASLAPEGPTLGDAEPDLIDASIIQRDVRADNGIVQVIDRVMLPVDLPGDDAPTIAGLVAASGDFDANGQDFDVLLQAVTAAGLAPALADAAADLTVFAPNDRAFLRLVETLGFDGTSEADAFAYLVDALTLLSDGRDPIPLLTQILQYHVLPGSLQASQVLARDKLETLLGTDLGRNGTRLVDADPDVANPRLVTTDIQAANGIVHVINGVLLPADLDVGGANDLVIGGEGADAIATGRGRDRVDGNGGNDAIALGRANDLGLGGAGDDAIAGGVGRDRLLGNLGDDSLSGGSGRDRLVGGFGDDALSGGGGRDVFLFHGRGGEDRVLDFRDGDRLNVAGQGIERFADLDIERQGRSVIIDFGDGDSVTLQGVRIGQLDASDFIFT